MARLICLAGQSNAVGWGAIGQPYPGGWTANSKIKIWSPATGDFVVYAPGVNAGGVGTGETETSAFGAEGSLARCLSILYPEEDIFIYKQAAIGIGITPASGDDWSPMSAGKQFSAMCRNLEVAQAQASAPIDTFVYQGCETDALTQAQADQVSRHLALFLTAVRERFKSPHMLSAIPRVHSSIVSIPPGYPATPTVQYHQELCASWPRTISFSTDWLATNPDIHFSPKGLCDIGEFCFFWSSRFR